MAVIAKAIALGLSTGAFCLGHCLPLVASFLLAREHGGTGNRFRSVLFFLGGRLFAYLLFGFVVGIFGSYLKEIVVIQRTVIPWLFLLLGMTMVVFGLLQAFPHARVCGIRSGMFGSDWHLCAAGFLTGMNLCPPFLLTLSYALTLGGIVKSMVFFFFFFCATSVFLLPLMFSHLVSRFKVVRTAARVCCVIVGLWFAVNAITLLLS